MKIIITGTTGYVGEGVMLASLDNPQIEKVLSVSRRPTGHTHPKLEEYIVPDFMALEPGDPKENITFVYLSGAGNYNSKTQMWVRVKKSTEDAVLLLGHVPVLQARRHVEQDERGR